LELTIDPPSSHGGGRFLVVTTSFQSLHLLTGPRRYWFRFRKCHLFLLLLGSVNFSPPHLPLFLRFRSFEHLFHLLIPTMTGLTLLSRCWYSKVRLCALEPGFLPSPQFFSLFSRLLLRFSFNRGLVSGFRKGFSALKCAIAPSPAVDHRSTLPRDIVFNRETFQTVLSPFELLYKLAVLI